MAKRHPRFRPRVWRPPAARLVRRLAIAAIATASASLALASPSLASTGTVFFDAHGNVAAGDPAHLFNASFTGDFNTGIGDAVMPHLTTGTSNVSSGFNALEMDTEGTPTSRPARAHSRPTRPATTTSRSAWARSARTPLACATSPPGGARSP